MSSSLSFGSRKANPSSRMPVASGGNGPVTRRRANLPKAHDSVSLASSAGPDSFAGLGPNNGRDFDPTDGCGGGS